MPTTTSPGPWQYVLETGVTTYSVLFDCFSDPNAKSGAIVYGVRRSRLGVAIFLYYIVLFNITRYFCYNYMADRR